MKPKNFIRYFRKKKMRPPRPRRQWHPHRRHPRHPPTPTIPSRYCRFEAGSENSSWKGKLHDRTEKRRRKAEKAAYEKLRCEKARAEERRGRARKDIAIFATSTGHDHDHSHHRRTPNIIDQALAMRVHGVDGEFVKQMRGLGFTDLDT